MGELSFERRLSDLENEVRDLKEERRKEIEFERDIIAQKMFRNIISMNNTSLALKLVNGLGLRDSLQDWQVRYLDFVLKGASVDE